MLAFSNDYYGMIFRATQSVELFCAYPPVARFKKLSAKLFGLYNDESIIPHLMILNLLIEQLSSISLFNVSSVPTT